MDVYWPVPIATPQSSPDTIVMGEINAILDHESAQLDGILEKVNDFLSLRRADESTVLLG
jgi:hypothetical protein